VIAVEVARYSGTHPGLDIIDPLIGSTPCALARGQSALDAQAKSKTKLTLSVVPSPSYRVGQIVEIRDTSQGSAYRAKIVGVNHRWSAPSGIDSEITIQRYEPIK